MRRGVPLRGHESTRCLRYPNQATFHPTKYLQGLARCIRSASGELFADTAVIERRGGRRRCCHQDRGDRPSARRDAVVATNSPINDRVALHSKQAPYRTYAMAFNCREAALPDALYWDTLDPYHYVRHNPGKDVDYLIVGGADHKSGEADDAEVRFEAIEAWIRNLVPALGRVTHRWSGQVLDTIDYSAFSGRNPGSKNVYVHTGNSGQGMTHGVVGSLIIARMIMQGESCGRSSTAGAQDRERDSALSSARTSPRSKIFAEYVAPGELGFVRRDRARPWRDRPRGLKKVAAYRDETGALHAHSAACTHLGCHVHWNSFERCWDCPCHGSQFAVDGAVLNGPAIHPLQQIEVEETASKSRRTG